MIGRNSACGSRRQHRGARQVRQLSRVDHGIAGVEMMARTAIEVRRRGLHLLTALAVRDHKVDFEVFLKVQMMIELEIAGVFGVVRSAANSGCRAAANAVTLASMVGFPWTYGSPSRRGSACNRRHSCEPAKRRGLDGRDGRRRRPTPASPRRDAAGRRDTLRTSDSWRARRTRNASHRRRRSSGVKAV